MSVFAALPEEKLDVAARLDDKYSGFQGRIPTVFLLSSKNLRALVANELGLIGENRISLGGCVEFRLRDIHAGRAGPSEE